MTPNNDESLKIQRRIQKANRKFMFMWVAIRISLTFNKINHLKVAVRYGCCWPLEGGPIYRLGEKSAQEELQFRSRKRVQKPRCHQRREDKQIVLCCLHDQKTWKSTFNSCMHSITTWNEMVRKSKNHVGGWSGQR
jgi:hypothetical protein